MPSVTYMNRSAPFWDFVASLEQEGTNHPFFSQWAPNHNESAGEGQAGDAQRGEHAPPPPPFGPWGWGFPGFGGERDLPHRGPPPPPGPPPHEEHSGEKDNEKNNEKNNDKDGDDIGEGPSGSGSDTEGCRRGKGRQGRCGARRGRHGCGPHGRGFGPGPHHGPPHHGHHGRRGGWGPWARGGPFGFGGGPFNPLNLAANLFDVDSSSTPNHTTRDNEDFKPDADIFSTPSAYVIHISLPGAKKEDVGVNWDAEKSELSIAGVVYRPGDEEFLKTLEMGERKVGPFERKVRLGTRANPAVVDVEGITAKLEDGVLRVEVPKMEEGFVEVKKVDIE
jgi:HSP20 family protein